MKKVYISLTTIPSRIQHPNFIEHMKYLQQQSCEKIFITLPQQYRRFEWNSSCETIITQILAEFPMRFEILSIPVDYGPACKFLGPLLYKSSILQNNILLIVDDDRYYDLQMSHLYMIFFQTHPGIHIATGNQFLYFNQKAYLDCHEVNYRVSNNQYVAAFMSFAFVVSDLFSDLVHYTQTILKHLPDAFYHDEGILVNYLKFKEIIVYTIQYRFINIINKEMPDSLVEGNHVNRRHVENQIRQFTNQIHYFPKHLSLLQLFRQSSPIE